MAAVCNNVKLINETNKILRLMTTSSLKDLNQDHIKYIIFHRNGICSAILDHSLTTGEVLIISRFLSLVFRNNLLSLCNLKNQDFVKLLSSLLNGLKFQRDNYYWTTALSILSQGSIVEFFCQSEQIVQTFKNIFLDPHPHVLHLVKSTVISISHLLIKVLENCNSNSEYMNYNIINNIARICCFLVVHLLVETGISGKEIQTITKYLFQFRDIVKIQSDESKASFITKNEAMVILEKLKEENTLNCRKEVVIFIKNILPYLSYYLNERNVTQTLCQSCCSVLQKTTDPRDCVRLMTLAGEIIYHGSKLSSQFLHDGRNVKSLMGFMKVLPKSLPHSDARNILWWHVLCSLNADLFQNRFKTYFVPFIENILGKYFNRNQSNYEISEFNLMNGYLHLSQLANHVIINIVDNINMKKDTLLESRVNSDILVPDYMQFSKLRNEVFTMGILSSEENMGYLVKAVEMWIEILKCNQQKTYPMNTLHGKTVKGNGLPVKRKFHCLDNEFTDIGNEFPEKIYPRNTNNDQREDSGRQVISLSSDEAEISLVSEENDFVPTKLTTSQVKPVVKIATTGHPNKRIILNSVQTKSVEIPISNYKVIELKNLLQFFKNNQIDGKYFIKNHGSLKKGLENMSKYLPLKKRKFDIKSDYLSTDESKDTGVENENLENSTNSIVVSNEKNLESSNNMSTSEVYFPNKDQAKEIQKRHSYFLRGDVYNNNSATFDQTNSKAGTKKQVISKIPKANVDFTVNVSESSRNPNSKILLDNSNQIFSKKVELRIKFDLNPLSNIYSSGLELGNNKTKNDNETQGLIDKNKLNRKVGELKIKNNE